MGIPVILVGEKIRRARQIISVSLVVWCILVPIIQLPSYFAKFVPGPSALSITLIGALILYFLIPKKKAEVIKYIDILPFILGLPALLLTAFNYDRILEYEGYGSLDTLGMVLAFSLAIGLLIAAWRAASPIR